MTQTVEQHVHPSYNRLVVLRRNTSRFYHCRTYLNRALIQHSLKTDELTLALKLAEEWYKRQLRASLQQQKAHPISSVTRSTLISELFVAYVKSLRNEKHVVQAEMRWGPIQPFWRTIALAEVSADTFEDFYRWRKNVKPITLNKDVGVVRQVLKYAALKHPEFVLPAIPKVGRIEPNPRPWLSKAEWEHLRTVAELRVTEAVEEGRHRTARQRLDAFEFAAFMVASMCRVDELRDLRFERCQVEQVEKRKILRCEFRGKRGVRVAYAAPEAVSIYLGRFKLAGQDGSALVFPHHHRDAFRELLTTAKLYVDHFGNKRNYKAMRATAIALALLRPNPPSIYQIALNAGTSVAMIEKFYAKRLTAESGKDILTATEPLPRMWSKRRR